MDTKPTLKENRLVAWLVLAAAVLGVLIGKVSDRVGMHLITWMEQVWKERTVH